MRPLVLNEKSKATYQSYKNKEIEWYMCDLSKILKLLIAIDLSIEHEINDYNNQPKPDEESNESGILEGRYEFALQLWNIINKEGSNNLTQGVESILNLTNDLKGESNE